MATAISIVNQFFPDVTAVEDATEPLTIEVTKRDSNSAKVRDHKACAMAVACKRTQRADGVIVSINRCYVIFGHKAIRYNLPESVAREVVSFDRDAGFAPGTYSLIPVNPANKLGTIKGGGNTGKAKKKMLRHHQTSGIRTVLGSHLT